MKAVNYLQNKKRFLIAFVICCFALQGCMSNDEIILETQKCEKAGMSYGYIMSEFGSVYSVVCVPKPETEK